MVMDMEQKTIFAIDPGDVESGFAIIRMPDFVLCEFGKIENEKMLEMAENYSRANAVDIFAIEMIDSYGMSVGKTVFETCVWIGRFIQAVKHKKYTFVYRKDEKICLCGSLKAKDSNIRQALIDRYAKHDFKSGKGVKKNPDTFYGVSKDVWQAIAVGVTCYENSKEGEADAKQDNKY
jgi:hypothetical protein